VPQQAMLQRFAVQPPGKESPYLQHGIQGFNTTGKEDLILLQNMTPSSARVLGAAESRFQVLSGGQGTPVYPLAGDISLVNARKGTETAGAGYNPSLLNNNTDQPAKPLANQRNYLKIFSPVLFIFISSIP
jgi:hypothetical protein